MNALAMKLEDVALQDLRYYLRSWRRWVRAWRAPLGLPSAIPLVGKMVPSVSAYDEIEEEEINAVVMRQIDAEVESLPADKRAAVRLVYLNEVLPAVFRSARWSKDRVYRLCDQAEVEMVPKLRARGVVLGGR